MTDPQRTLTSGQMVRASGLSIKALRLYDANGLLVPVHVDPRNGYRAYAHEQVDRARQIALLRRLDLPLAQVAQVLDAEPERARQLLLAWWAERNASHAQQRVVAIEAAVSLGVLEEHLGADAELVPAIRERTVPERTVATITSRPNQTDLVPTFMSDVLTIRQHLAAAGVDTGTGHHVIFHQPPIGEMAGRIETCVAFRGSATPVGELMLRAEAARTEAYLEVPVRDCSFPQIVRYHETLRGLAAGSTREVYRGSWSDEPGEIVAEVAIAVGA